MINIIIGAIQNIVGNVQKTISLAIANWPFLTLISITGLTFEEFYYGFRIIKYLGFLA